MSNNRMHDSDFTMLRLEDGNEAEVGDLAREAGISNPQEKWPMSEKPYVFLSHTGKDSVKDEIARPTHWFLTRICGVKAFLDDVDASPGIEKTLAMLEPAYRCTHAIVLLSDKYRSRKYCVQELNTFILRYRQEPRTKFRIIPALWRLENSQGYAEVLHELITIRVDSHSSASRFMIDTLWPKLLGVLKQDIMDPEALQEHLVNYVQEHRGRKWAIPMCLESFVSALHDSPVNTIIIERLKQMESMSRSQSSLLDMSSDISTYISSLTSDERDDEDTISCKTIKQFWKLEAPAGKLVKMERCTISQFAPFTIGAPWLKAQEHLELRQDMESNQFEPNQEAKANAMLAVTAGQMVLRMREFKNCLGGIRYLGLYQAIVRNSIPLFVTRDYFETTLSKIYHRHDVIAFEADVIGRIIKLPQEFTDAFADFMKTERIRTDIIDDTSSIDTDASVAVETFAILVGEEGTLVEYIEDTPYLDGDIWVAVEENGVTSFKSRFCNLADKEDLIEAIDSLKKEVESKKVVFQFDLVKKRFKKKSSKKKW